MRAFALTVAATVLLLAGGCRRPAAVGREGRLEPAGNVLLTARGGDPVSIRSERTLRTGDVVEVSDGSATVVLPDGGSLELRPRTVVAFDKGPELRSGDLLVVTERAPQIVRAAGSSARAEGAVRLAQSLSLRVATYTGSASLESGGRSIDVPALRQVAVPALGVLPGGANPIALAREDPWDKRFLGDVLDALDPLESLSHGFTGQVLPTDGRTAGFYRTLVPQLDAEPAFQQATVEQLREPGEVLVGATIALLGRRGSFGERLAGAATFRAEGAPWALVARDQDVPSFDTLRRAVEDAVGRAPLQFAAAAEVPPAARDASPTASAGRRPRSAPAPTPTTSPPPPAPSPSEPAPSPPPRSDPPPPPPDNPGVLRPIVDPVVALLDGLLGGGR